METKVDEEVETRTDSALKQLAALEETVVKIRQFLHEGGMVELEEVGIGTSMAVATIYAYVTSKSQFVAAQKILRDHGGHGFRLRGVVPCSGSGVYPIWTCSTLPWIELHWQRMDIEAAKAMGILKDTCRLETVTETRNTLVCDI